MDEVNLLDDGLVDVVLDSAASGVNVVEREGISITHPARFIMIGSGNPQVRCLQNRDRVGILLRSGSHIFSVVYLANSTDKQHRSRCQSLSVIVSQ